ncbi:hypothetical protein B5G34_06780 [Flavonifractor sp. An82]|uniref:hypothetical protein n=1 Tax=Flavonifractor sp. An82 TaxID=1965660 RepID=UPI000B3A63EF|nr:hypothetical protein [Flavonifractor sp. An82]OUN22570.1 hypothetical protein B5G34_06780 [Flavonifractor sp. An82]
MKPLHAVSALALTLLLLSPIPASANMAAPADPDIGSSITFERNDALAVTEEVLDIRVTGSTAEITATYSMVNSTDQPVSTPVMFLAPNTGDGSVEVTTDGVSVPCSTDQYVLNYTTEVKTEDWRYAVLTNGDVADVGGQTVEGISFQLDFGPGEACEVSVSYPYRLGGYPDYDYNVKRGTIRYYLAPAAMWRDFQDLTINLYLDRDMPVLAGSNLDFEKVGTRTYQYRSDSLPEGNLEIRVDQNWFQEIIGILRSPYLKMYLLFFSPVLLVIAAVIVVPILLVRRARRSKR